METIRKRPEQKAVGCEVLLEKLIQASRDRDTAYTDRERALAEVENMKRELVSTQMRCEQLRKRKVKALIPPAIVMAVLFGISMLAYWATAASVIIPSVGDGVRIIFGTCATFFAGIVWERAGVRWRR